MRAQGWWEQAGWWGEPFLEEEQLPFPTTKRQGHESTRLVRTGRMVRWTLPWRRAASISYNKETGSWEHKVGENRQDSEPFLEREWLLFPTTKRQGHESTRLVRTKWMVNPSLKESGSYFLQQSDSDMSTRFQSVHKGIPTSLVCRFLNNIMTHLSIVGHNFC